MVGRPIRDRGGDADLHPGSSDSVRSLEGRTTGVRCRPAAPTLFALCIRQLALCTNVDISRLPENFAMKIKLLRSDVCTLIRIYLPIILIRPSWICVNGIGDLDLDAIWDRCFRGLDADDRFRLAAINGTASRVGNINLIYNFSPSF